MRRASIALLLGLVACKIASPLSPGPGATGSYRYEVDLRYLDQQRLRVRVTVPSVQAGPAVFVIPKVVPGIYGVQNFGQYVRDVVAFDRQNRPLTVVRQDTNTWTIAETRRLHHLTYSVAPTWAEFRTGKGQRPVFYRSAGSSYHPDSAFVLNYNTFVGYLEGQPARSYQVRFTKPLGLYGASYLTPEALNDTIDRVRAPTYRELVDAPVLYARPDTAWLRLGKTRVLVALYAGVHQPPYAPAVARSLRTMLEAQQAYLGGTLPVEKYAFLLYHRTQGAADRSVSDGLEHSHSTLCLLESPGVGDLNEFVRGIAAHEFFHTVTPLHMHSEEIEHYDFRHPAFSEHLWLYEGLTEYETIHMPIREKLETLPEFIKVLEAKAQAMSKFNDTLALTRLSRQVATRQDQFFNFYLKGALFNLCLDIRLRELSGGRLGTQELTQHLLHRYGPHQPFRDTQLFDVLTQLTYPSMRAFFRDYLEDGRSLPLRETLAKVGLEYDPATHTIRLTAHPTPAQLALRQAWIGQ
ncbi:peptidase M61 [Siccationidurans ginsengisoli]|nr:MULTISPECIES: peptidase M61 [unclassified Hymenobacter]MBO2033746.1 peptidase M61 [Hymenobacter sp. BT559]